jgi:hypothetical protein
MIQPIQTFFDGYRFRSRTEARFAVMWRALGWPYQFEMQGFALEQGAFLPDFYLNDCAVFFEVKGTMPSDHQVGLCASLADAHDCTVFLAVGQPEHDAAVYRFPPGEDCLISTLRIELGSLGASVDEIDMAMLCARSARFEHGQKPITCTDPRLVNLKNARINHRNIQARFVFPGAANSVEPIEKSAPALVKDWRKKRDL